MPKMENLVGRKFGKLLVLGMFIKRKSGRIVYHCLCDCGNSTSVTGIYLKSGHTTSCGCLRKSKQTSFARMCTRLYKSYKSGAKRNNLVFDLTKSDLCVFLIENCFYCGQEPSNQYFDEVTGNIVRYTGIDRVNNTLGYTLGNCVPCCSVCNKAKRDMPLQDFYDWIERLIRYNE